jgi:hypothetical protein
MPLRASAEVPPRNVVSEPGEVRSCERVTLTRVVVLTGRGESRSPMREVVYFYADDGSLVAQQDPWRAQQADPEQQHSPARRL